MPKYFSRDVFLPPFLLSQVDVIGEFMAEQLFPPPLLKMAGRFNLSLIISAAIARMLQDMEEGVFDTTLLPGLSAKHQELIPLRSKEYRHHLYLSVDTMSNLKGVGEYLLNLPPELQPGRVRVGTGYNLRLITTLALMWCVHRIGKL